MSTSKFGAQWRGSNRVNRAERAHAWWNGLDEADRFKAIAWYREGGEDVLPERLIDSLQAADLLPATYPAAPPETVPWLMAFVERFVGPDAEPIDGAVPA
jgi:hypothetical protein